MRHMNQRPVVRGQPAVARLVLPTEELLLPLGVVRAARFAGLVAPSGPLNRRTPPRGQAHLGAVCLPPIAGPTDGHPPAAGPARK